MPRNRLQDPKLWRRPARVVKVATPKSPPHRRWGGVLLSFGIIAVLAIMIYSAESAVDRRTAVLALVLVLCYILHIFFYSRVYDLRTSEGRERALRETDETDKFN